MFNFTVHYLGIFIAGIAAIIVGGLWYSPLLFSKYWAQEAGWTKEEMERTNKKGMGNAYAIQFIGTIVCTWVLAVLFATLYVTTIRHAIAFVVLLWLGLQLPSVIGTHLWEKKSWGYVAVNAGHQLVSLIIVSIILVLL